MIDVSNERVEKFKNYEHVYEFGKIEASLRHSPHQHVEGGIIGELTVGNQGWSYITGSLLGIRTQLSGYKFVEKTNYAWGILIGYLSAALSDDSTSFTISETTAGDFNSVTHIVVNSEVIALSSVSNGVVSISSRGQLGTTAMEHGISDLVYGIVADASVDIVLTHRQKVNGFVEAGVSLTTVHDRDSILYGYTGCYVASMSFNFKTFEPIVIHANFRGADSTNDISVGECTATDNLEILDLADVHVYSEHQTEELRQFFIEAHTTLSHESYGYDGISQGYMPIGASTYGVITWTDSSLEHLITFQDNTKKHFSLSMASGTHRMVFAMNDVRVNTVSQYHEDNFLIQDSAPWYMYAAPVIMYQFGS